MSWLYLTLAVLFEVAGTMSLRQSEGLRKRVWIVPVVAAYLASFAFLSLVLSAGMPLGVAYGIWAALGISLTALVSRVLFGEPLTRVMGLGIAACGGGVLLVEIG